jgi:sugar phosphate isomerase/epimerase
MRLDADFEEHMAMAERVFEVAEIFGAKYVRMFSFYAPEGETMGPQYKDQIVSYLGRMIEAAKAHGLVLCHENEGRVYGESPESCLELLEHFGGELRCVFDMGNFVLGGYDPVAAYDMLLPYIEYFHIKDALKSGAVVPPGKGEAHIQELLSRHAKSVDHPITVSLEPHLMVFAGLKDLTNAAFTNPYQYESHEAAFTDAANKLKEMLAAI